jgi:hypothetical protein
VSLVCLCCPWLVLAPKVLQLCTNHFVWIVCRLVWVSEACQLFLVPSQSSNMPLYPSKCCELGSVPRFLSLPLSFIWIHIWVLQGVGSASLTLLILNPFCISKTKSFHQKTSSFFTILLIFLFNNGLIYNPRWVYSRLGPHKEYLT